MSWNRLVAIQYKGLDCQTDGPKSIKKENRGEKEFFDSFLDVYWEKGVELMPFILVYKGPSIWQSSLVPFLVLPLKKLYPGARLWNRGASGSFFILGETIVTNGAREYTVIKLS